MTNVTLRYNSLFDSGLQGHGGYENLWSEPKPAVYLQLSQAI